MGIQVFPAASGGVTQKVQEFTSTGTFTAPSNVSAVEVFLVAGGGGGGYALTSVATRLFGSGGGGGQVISRMISVTPGTAYTVTIGAGGSGSTSAGSAGGTGGDTTFGALATAKGGGGGGSRDNSSGTAAFPGKGGGGFTTTTSSPSGAGGGAGGAATNGNVFDTLSGAVQYNNTSLGVTSYGLNHGTPAPNSQVGVLTISGPGIDGYGNGGAGGIGIHSGSLGATRSGASYSGTGRPGYWDDGTTSVVAGVNASANTGDGGHGSSTTQTANASVNGLNGGSGYARITYWS